MGYLMGSGCQTTGRAYVAGYDVIPVVCHLEEGSVKAYHITCL